MSFDEILTQIVELLQRQGRVSYGALRRRFALDEDYLQDLKDELIDAQQIAVDEGGKILVWAKEKAGEETGNRRDGESESSSKLDARLKTSDARPLEAERRQLTVMFCDLVGSTALSEQIDPEELREVIRAYQETGARIISRYEGHIAQYLGDGLLVYFGYPAAHEDDAARAVRAGLKIVEAIHESSQQGVRLQQPLQARIGIHTGQVVIGEMGGGERYEQLALGETPNIAARVQGKAEPNEIVTSAATYRLVEGLFECEARGPQELKGVSTPLALYHVVRESEAQSRFQVAVRTGLTPLVGREHELGLLRERWESAQHGKGQVVLLSGEPGIGKSRLVQELKEQVLREGATRIELRCSPYHQNSALYPVTEHIQHLLQFGRNDTPTVKLDKLHSTLSHYRFPQADTVPLLASLLSLPHLEGIPPLTWSPQKQKEKTQEILVAWLCEEAERKAVYCAWEDLHWADPSTLELLTLFLDQVPTARMVAVLTFRPEFMPPWGSRSHISHLTLSRLGYSQVIEMVEKVTGGKALPAEVIQQIVNKTDGISLFVEELTKTVVESGLVREVNGHYELTEPLPPLAIPATLQDSLMARLDRLAPVRAIAQLGATIGREFSYELIQAVSPLDEAALQQGLNQLVEAELLYQEGLSPHATYLFKHALLQEVAYQSLLRSTRQQYHQQIAHVLQEQFFEVVQTQPELLAHHYTEAGLQEEAIGYWQMAGQRSAEQSANLEAVSHFTKGLELLKTLPDTPERTQQELSLQIALGAPLTAAKGYAAPEVGSVYTRARELCQQVGKTRQVLPVLFGLWRFYLQRADLPTARELGEQCLSLAQRAHNPLGLLRASNTLGVTLFYLGELTSAREHLEQGIALPAPQPRRSAAFVQDPRVSCLSYGAWAVWHLGYPDQALKRSQAALALARERSHPYSLAMALFFTAALHLWCREVPLTQEWAEAAITLSTEQEFPFWLAQGRCMRGWALVEQGQREEGVAQIRQGLATYRTTGAVMGTPYYLTLLAEAYGHSGQVEKGLSVLAEALAEVHKSGECFYEARQYQLKGELTLQSRVQNPESRVKEAEECFRRAIGIARRQSAKSLELRAAMSLSRLWQQQGKKNEARQMLAEVYGWFTEGFDTADLQEAKALLEAL